MKIEIYHNPKCSKSRQTLALLEEKKVPFEIIEYLKEGVSLESLEKIKAALSKRPKEFIRTKESELSELNLDLDDDQSVMNAIVQLPKLLERPIVIVNGIGKIGRPPEDILLLFKS